MRNINSFKTILVSVVLLLFGTSISAQCDHSDDFNSTAEAFYPSYNGGLTTTNGWYASSCERYGDFFSLFGYIKSPVFPKGCNSLSFKYAKDGWYADGYPSFVIEIQKEIGGVWTTVWTETITNPSAVDDVFNDVSYDNLEIEGNVQLVITRLTENGYNYSEPPAGDVPDFKDFCLTNFTSFSHKSDKPVSRTRSSSLYRATVKFTDLFNYPDGWTGKEKIQDSTSIDISFVSTNDSKLKFDGYYSNSAGQYFYYLIPAGAYGNDTLTVSVTYKGVTAESYLIAAVAPIVCVNDAYTLSAGDTSVLNVTSNDSPSAYYDKSTLEILKGGSFGTATLTDTYSIEYINDAATPNYSKDTLVYRMADVDGNYDTANVVLDIHYDPYVTKVFDFLPGPGQFVNTTWATATSGSRIIGNTSSGVTLGGYGGYIIAGFDQPIINREDNPYGVDFSVKGNAFTSWAEPAAVQVMKDENGNGLPDDTWYELAGSEYHFSTSIKDLTMTYYNPKYDGRYTIPFRTDKGFNGAMRTNGYHSQSYYPEPYSFGISKDSVSYTGTYTKFLLDKSNASYITAKRFPIFGYADNKPNASDLTVPTNPYTDSKGNGFDLEWAVDAYGNHIELDTVHFVKVYSTVQEDGGWLGEVSPEIFSIGITTPDASYTPQDYYIHAIGAGQLQVLKGTAYQYEGCLFKNGIPQEGTATWVASVDSVGTIDNTGLFTANKCGSTYLKFQVADSITADSIEVEVVELARVLIEMDSHTTPDTTTAIEGEIIYIHAEAIDNRGSSSRFVYEDYDWESTNPEIGTIDDGLFKALSIGVTKVYATSVHNPTLSDSIVVVVKGAPKAELIEDTVTIDYFDRTGFFYSDDLFTVDGGATVFYTSVIATSDNLTAFISNDSLNYSFKEGAYGYATITLVTECYSILDTFEVVLQSLNPYPEIMATAKQVVFVNGGEFTTGSPANPTNLNTYIPSEDTTIMLDNWLAGASSVQDMVIDGAFAYVSADYYITRYNLSTGEATDSIYTQDTSAVVADGAGTDGYGVNHKMAVYRNLLLVTRQNSSYAPEDGYNVRIYNKTDLSLVKKIPVSDQATDIVIIGDTAYTVVNGGFAGTTSSMAIIDLETLQLVTEVDLGTNGLGVMTMIAKGNNIYCSRLEGYYGVTYSSGMIVYNILDRSVSGYTYTAGVSYDSSPLLVELPTGDTIFVKKDLGFVAFNTTTNTFGSDVVFPIPSRLTQTTDYIARGSVHDTADNRYYMCYGYWLGDGAGEIYDGSFQSIGTFKGVGASPEVIKICPELPDNNAPYINSELKDVTFEQNEPIQFTIGSTVFEDSEDDVVDLYLFNPASVSSWLGFSSHDLEFTGLYTEGLEKDTSFNIILQAVDAYGLSVVDSFVITITPVDETPVVAGPICDLSGVTGTNTTVALAKVFDGFDNPMDFSVTLNSNSSVASISIDDDTLFIDFQSLGQTTVIIEAVSANGSVQDTFYAATWPVITGDNTISDFEDLSLQPESYWNGSDGSGRFNSGLGNFFNNYDATYLSWYGWAYSNISDNVVPGYANQYSAITGSGIDTLTSDGKNYAVSYLSTNWTTYSIIPHALKFSDSIKHNVKGFFITNDTYTALSMQNGDSYAKKFGGSDGNDADYLKILIWGLEDGATTDTVEFYLADYRSSDNSEDYIIKTWQWVDLESLGVVDSVMFSIASSDEGSYGINTPTYFCIDNFVIDNDDGTVVASPIADVSVTLGDNDTIIDISGVFADPDDDGAVIIKGLASNSDTTVTSAIASGDGLSLRFLSEGTSTIVVSGTSNGKAAVDTFTVTVLPYTGISIAAINEVKVFPNPFVNGITIETSDTKPFTVVLLDMKGSVLMQLDNIIHGSYIGLESLSSGQYVIQLIDNNYPVTKQVIIKK